ncbi:hypothetical protein ZIOFF_060906 [Zingiber officinale]|uniref:Uncharacterized protein n=1 Tax=Zingiber officinale TaxID=94328 RepID=A0A8J5KLY2_ZINOF|nr:hypothetical protein ZIOFF_060906 [Zingiber officinale]
MGAETPMNYLKILVLHFFSIGISLTIRSLVWSAFSIHDQLQYWLGTVNGNEVWHIESSCENAKIPKAGMQFTVKPLVKDSTHGLE